MAYNALNNLIDAYIYPNGVQAITGSILNNVLKAMVSQLGGGYNLMGMAAPASSPAVNDEPLAYFAATAGTYTNFDGIVLAAGEVAVLLTSGNGSWSKQTIYNVPTGTADLANTAGFITSAVNSLVNYYTKTEIDTALAGYTTTAALATALADYYNKTSIDAQMATRYTKSEVDTKLGDYYRKTETYDKDEVDSIVAALSHQEYIVSWDGTSAPVVANIPAGVTVTYSGTPYTGTLAASASTVNKIYMVWNGTAYDMYGTSQDGGYSWVPMGTTSVDLSQYATKAELSQLDLKVNGGERTTVLTKQGNSSDQFVNLSDIGYPANGDTYVYFIVTNPGSNFNIYGLGQGSNDTLQNYRSVEWIDQANGKGRVGILSGNTQLVITSVNNSSVSIAILSYGTSQSLSDRIDGLSNAIDDVTEDVEEIKETINGGRSDILAVQGTSADQFINREDIGYPTSGGIYVYFRVSGQSSNFAQYGLGQGNNDTLSSYCDVTWVNEGEGLGYVGILATYNQIVVTSAVSASATVTILNSEEVEGIIPKLNSLDGEIEKVKNDNLSTLANVGKLEGNVFGGLTVIGTFYGNGSNQVFPLDIFGSDYRVGLYFKVSGTIPGTFCDYGLGVSSDGETLAQYKTANWIDEENGIGYISVSGYDYFVLTTALTSAVKLEIIDYSNYNYSIIEDTIDLQRRVYGGPRAVFSQNGTGENHFINLSERGLAVDELSRLYFKVDNPGANFGTYGLASSDDGETLKNYLSVTWIDENSGEGVVILSTPYIAVTSATTIPTKVTFYSLYQDGIGKVYTNGLPIVSFVDDDSGKYVPDIWGTIIQDTGIRMGFACITGFMSGLPAPEIYEQMTFAEIKALYDNGHEVYSHSYTHPGFFDDDITPDMVAEQCRRSKDWLLANGFFRGADIIVYPGGLGRDKHEKEDAVRRYYRYGIDTTGGGVNALPLVNKLRVARFNADTGTLQELKDKVDAVIESGGLLVFMNHAYELHQDRDAEITKIESLITYINDAGIKILPLGEALNEINGI